MKITRNDMILGLFNNIALIAPIILGLIAHNIQLGVFGAFGALVYNYYVPQENKKGLVYFGLMGTIAFVGFFIGLLINIIPWVTPIFICTLGGLTLFINKRWNIIGPGPFFIMMIGSMAGTQAFVSFQRIETVSWYLLIGILSAAASALAAECCLHVFHGTFIPEQSRFNNDSFLDVLMLLSIGYAIAIFLAFYIGKNLQLFNYYWIVVACAAVMKAENSKHAFTRFHQYVIGAAVGCGLSFVLMSLPLNLTTHVVTIVLLNTLIYWQINKNYLVGNFFTTPLALLLFKLLIPQLNNDAIIARLVAVVIGTTLGLLFIFLTEKTLHYVFPHRMTKFSSR
ncbi:FUSC family protein [Secundilactobacillus kimchicus]|nr:FUSC family protein [Secundilactobacillus kimchicus]